MKIIFSDNSIWGLINFRQDIYNHFYNLGYEIVLVAPNCDKTLLKIDIPSYVRYIPIELERGGYNPFNDLNYFFKLYKIYRKENPDYIFHYTIKPNIYGTLAAKFAGINSTAMIAGLGYVFNNKSFSNRIARKLFKFGLKYSQNIFILNEGNKELLIKHKIVNASKLILLKGGEGINTDLVKEAQIQNESHKTTFLMVSRALYDKGYAEFVKAAKKIKENGYDANFLLLGPIDESYPKSVTKAQIENDVNSGFIAYEGFTKEPFNIMSKPGTVIVLPSYHEGFSRSLMEGCALGKPIIASDIPGCREMVNDGINGFLVKVKDSDSLCKAMEKYLNLPLSKKIEMGHAGRELAIEKLDIKHVIREYDKIINKLIKK